MEVSNSIASFEELPEIVVTACSQTSEERRGIILSILRDLIEAGETERIVLAKGSIISRGLLAQAETYEQTGPERTGRGHQVAAVAVKGKDQTANLLAIGGNVLTLRREQSEQHLRSLLEFVHQQLARVGTTFVQAMRDLSSSDAGLLHECRYERLAELDYLCTAVNSMPVAPKSNRKLGCETEFENVSQLHVSWESYAEAVQRLGAENMAFKMLLQTVEETYEGSLDCPTIAAYRDTKDVLEGYRTAPGYDPRLWFFCHASDGRVQYQGPLGCLLLTKHPAGGSIEVTYMGVGTHWRGKGLGSELLWKSQQEAFVRGVPHLTLAVDRSNFPALRIYQRHGFQCLLSEAVWGRKIGLQISEKES